MRIPEAMDDFLANPTVEGLRAFKKPDLLILSEKLELVGIKSVMRKAQIQREIAGYYFDEDVFTQEDFELFPEISEGKLSDHDLSLKKLEFEMEMKRLELEREREREERENRKLELENRERERIR